MNLNSQHIVNSFEETEAEWRCASVREQQMRHGACRCICHDRTVAVEVYYGICSVNQRAGNNINMKFSHRPYKIVLRP